MDELTSPGKPFDISKRAVWEAYEKVKASKGAPRTARTPGSRARPALPETTHRRDQAVPGGSGRSEIPAARACSIISAAKSWSTCPAPIAAWMI